MHYPLRFISKLSLSLGTAFLALSAPVRAQSVSLTGTYSQNFDALANSGTSSVVPDGWYFLETGTSASANGLYTAGTGSNNAGDTYSFGPAGATDRAFGGVRSGTINSLIGASFTNNTGATITTLTVKYTGEQWRLGLASRTSPDRLDFQYSTDATSINTGTWTDVDALDFNSPILAGTVGALNGNADANRTQITGTISGLSIPVGATIWIRFSDFDVASSDDGLAVDDFSVSTSSTPPANQPPITSTVTDQIVTVGQPFALTFPSFTDPEGQVITYAATGYPAGITFDAASRSFGGTPTQTGTFPITITGTDTENLTSSTTFTLTVIDAPVGGFTPIASARTLSRGAVVTIAGRVTVSNQFGARLFYIQDQTGGVAIYSGASPKPDLTEQVQLGDSVQVSGPIDVYNGYVEVNGVNSLTVVADAGQRIPAPKEITIDQMPSFQGQLVKVAGAVIGGSGATFSGNVNYPITVGASSSVLRINTNSELVGASKLTSAVDLVGISERFKSGATTVGPDGLQLQARILSDVPGAVPVPLEDQYCGGTGGSEISKDKTFDMVTWNTEFFGADAGVIACPTRNLPYKDMGPVNEVLQAQNAKKVLEKLDADIIVVEEVSDQAKLSEVVNASGYSLVCSDRFSYYFQNECDQTPDNQGFVFGPTHLAQKVCVIYKNSTVTPILEESKPLLMDKYTYPADNNWSSGRLPYLFVANVNINGVTKKMHIVGIHAKSGSATADYNRRRQDILDLKAELDATYPNANVIIAGDFNDGIITSIASGKPSTYKPFDDDAANYTFLTKPLEAQGCKTFDSGSFLDHLVISNELQSSYIANSTAILLPGIVNYATTTSDHYPVLARFDFGTPLALEASTTPAAICSNASATVAVSVSGGKAPYTYSWSGAGTITNANSATATVSNLTETASFTVTVTDANNQTAKATATVNVQTLPTAPALASVTATQGSSDVVLTAANCSGTLVWTGNSTGSGNTITVSTANVGEVIYQVSCQVGDCVSAPTSVTVTVVPKPSSIKVQYQDGDYGQMGNNNIKPNLQLVNTGTTAVPYSELKVRYWFTAENFAGINTWIDYAQLGNNRVSMKYVALTQPRNGATGYVEYSFDASAGTLAANGNSGPIQSRFANSDWSNLNETDDYSYKAGSAYALNEKITVYRNGELIWGQEPEIAPATTKLKVYSENKNYNTNSNSISTYLKIDNEGNTPVAYGDLTVRYWFTAEGTTALNYWIDYAKLGNANVTGQFVRLSPTHAGADTYFEIKVKPTVGTLQPLSSTGNIQYRIAKTNWSAFNEADDHSYKPAAPFAENNRVTVYHKGVLIYGTEPFGNANARVAAWQEGATSLEVTTIGNPVTDKLQVVVKGAQGERLQLRLTDINGREIETRQVEAAGAQEQQTFDVLKQPAGMLLLQATTSQQTQVVKVLKQ